ncbi:DNA polymerase eta isoform X6 [Lycium ferocissimum]|uniref:DNA polymerase eta isoform X6 n=1 Tax=Lycium ferocissimum TaxID=112874 RepID=UPI002814BAA1|nr:DNA polymerase eta isoform X6 [Lycium ferocissimum]
MPVAKPELSDSRVIAHVDMDCFYVQVEQRKQRSLRGKPTAVVQYNSWQGGGLIAVSYEARKFGVKRSMRGDEAKQVCPEIHLVQVPVARGKADLNDYRNAGSEVVTILARRGRCERASIDEVYLDLTIAAEAMLADNPPERLETISEEAVKSHILGLEEFPVEVGSDAREKVRHWLTRSDASRRDKLLACGALVVAELRLQVLEETEFTCSAGIAHNKMLAKLASGMNKPAQQTVVPFSSVSKLLGTLPIKKMKQLGGKLGTSLQIDLGVNTVGDLLQFSEEKLQDYYGVNTGSWLWNTARGINGEEVKGRLLPNSHGSGKTFPGPRALKTVANVEKWLSELCEELSERLQSDLEQNKRIAHTLTLHAHAYKGTRSIMNYFHSQEDTCPQVKLSGEKLIQDAPLLSPSGSGGHLTLRSTEPRIAHCEEDTETKDSLPLDRQEEDKEMGKEKLPDKETSICSSPDAEVYRGWEKDQTESCGDYLTEKIRDTLESEEGKKSNKEKGMSTISRYFQSQHSGSLLKGEHASTSKLREPFSLSDCQSELLQRNSLARGESSVDAHLCSQIKLKRPAWSYDIDEIDQDVLNELPQQIQEEVQAWLRPQKRSNTVKRDLGITRYFLPAKDK